MEEIIIICIVTFFVSFILSLFLMCKYKHKKYIYNIADHIVFILTLFPILSSIIKWGTQIEQMQNKFELYMEGNDSIAIVQLLNSNKYHIVDLIRPEYAAPDYEDYILDNRVLYNWIENNKDTILKMMHEQNPIYLENFHYGDYLKTKHFDADIKELRDKISHYNNYLQKKQEMENEIKESYDMSVFFERISIIFLITSFTLYMSRWIVYYRDNSKKNNNNNYECYKIRCRKNSHRDFSSC